MNYYECNMGSYLNRALKDDVSDSQLMNVIRIILNLPITNNGCPGENHYLTAAKRERMKLAEAEKNRVEMDRVESSDEEVEEIAKLLELNI